MTDIRHSRNFISVGEIFNRVGELYINHVDGRYYWVLSDETAADDEWLEEIPKYLYDALIKFERDRVK